MNAPDSADSRLYDLVSRLFDESIEAKARAREQLVEPVVAAAELIRASLDRGGKVLSCGNGGSAADAQHFAAELVNRFEVERRALAAVALTTDTSTLTSVGNDRDFSRIFSRQVEALARAGDVLLAITTSGNSPNIEEAITAAHEAGCAVVLLTGRDGGTCATLLRDLDVELRVPHTSTARIQEVHILLLHCVCSLLDHQPEGRQ